MSIWAARAAGCRWGFRLAVLLIVAWAAAGPLFRSHESWTTTFTVATTSVTFLLVFLIQNAQNRELKAVHLKLDELIFSAKNARNELIHIEHLTEEQLDRLGRRYSRLAAMHQDSLRRSAEGAIRAKTDNPPGSDLVGGHVVDTPALGVDAAVGSHSPAVHITIVARSR